MTKKCHPLPWLTTVAGVAVLLLVVGCKQQTPEERVAELRSGYTAELSNFLIEEVPLVTEEIDVAAEAEGEQEEPEPPAAETEEGEPGEAGEVGDEAAEPIPTRQDARLDILIRNTNQENLPGLTLDISMADAQDVEKEHWLVWVDTSQIWRGPGNQVSHVLEDVPYEEGDGFHVKIRESVPPGERADYREFQTP